MNFRFSEEQENFRHEVRDFLEKELSLLLNLGCYGRIAIWVKNYIISLDGAIPFVRVEWFNTRRVKLHCRRGPPTIREL